MGRFLTPTDPYESFLVGCMRVYYPDSPLLHMALVGQLAELESRFVWDTGGDIQAAEKLEQDWLAAGEMTRAALASGCADTAALQLRIDELEQELEDIENMQITVTCDANGCGTGYPFPTLENPDLTPTNTTPVVVDPTDPFDQNFPIWDDVLQTPPPGWADWQTFTSSRCLMANYAVDGFLQAVIDLDEAESKASVVMDIASVLLFFLPTPISKTKGIMTVAKWVASALTFLGVAEQYLDYLQWITDAIEDNKEELICWAYESSSVEATAALWYASMEASLLSNPALVGMLQTQKDALINWAANMFADFASIAQDWVAANYVPADYVPSVDCQSCSQNIPAGFSLLPTQVVSSPSYRINSGGSAPSHTIDPFGNVDFEFTASSGGGSVDINLVFQAPPIDPDTKYVGIQFLLEQVSNVALDSFRILASTEPGAAQMWSGVVTNAKPQRQHLIRQGAGGNTTPYPDPIAGEQIWQGTFVDIDSCNMGLVDLRLGCAAAAAGLVQMRISSAFWVVGEETTC